ncbi:MAG: nicotinate (nicotinamide) nucleotide adenylyltransferase [Planctomycetota bacterium]|nr:nicotinate (nicotinamide) nucleotide adenylyltransferase [Planctomycetota bacterium]
MPSSQPVTNPIALFGGVFDPIHLGHLAIAYAALELPDVTEVRWVLCKEPPHHKVITQAPAEARLAMTRMVCQEEDRFIVDTVEFDREGPSWTIDTVRTIAGQNPGRTLLWLIGSDNVSLIGKWREAEELWNLAIPVVANRPGSSTRLSRQHLPFIDGERWRLIKSWELPMISENISSTRLRHLLASGEDVSDWLPAAVLEALTAGGWYRSATS